MPLSELYRLSSDQWNVTSCPRSGESKSLAKRPRAPEKPPEPETPHPDQSAAFRDHHRPELFLRSGRMPVTQQLLDFSCRRGVRRPETISRPPVADQDFLRHAPISSNCPRSPSGTCPHPPPGLLCKHPVRKPPPRPAPLKRIHNPPLRPERDRFKFQRKFLSSSRGFRRRRFQPPGSSNFLPPTLSRSFVRPSFVRRTARQFKSLLNQAERDTQIGRVRFQP